jgi:hypothetical protein
VVAVDVASVAGTGEAEYSGGTGADEVSTGSYSTGEDSVVVAIASDVVGVDGTEAEAVTVMVSTLLSVTVIVFGVHASGSTGTIVIPGAS